jgi:hypothetical protein
MQLTRTLCTAPSRPISISFLRSQADGRLTNHALSH